MRKEKQRVSIRQKLQNVMLSLFAIALVINGIVGVVSLQLQRQRVRASDDLLGNTAAEDNAVVLLSQMKQSLQDIVTTKAELADARLGRYSSEVQVFSEYLGSLYKNADTTARIEVQPPQKKNGGVLIMQRGLENKSLKYADVADECSLLANGQYVFDPVIRETGNNVATIYLATESGLMLSYDASSDTASDNDGEIYYEFRDSDWYQSAKEAGKPVFTDTYTDSFGRGMTVTCAAPFYKEDGSFAGVVAMDILLSDLNSSIININLGTGTYAVLINRNGEIIASPNMSSDDETLQNIHSEDSPMYKVADQVMSGETGFLQASDDVYYAYTPITAADWTFVIHIPSTKITSSSDQVKKSISENTANVENQLDQQIRATITIYMIFFFSVMLGVVLLLRRFARSLTKPIIGLTKDVKVISDGDLDHRAAVSGNDEVGDLANAFNTMTSSIKKYISDLTAVTAEKERIGAELSVATKIQEDMLPRIFPPYPDRPEFDLYATMQPAKEVGGDLYDFFMPDADHLAIVIGDVSGKGVPAALFMVISKTLIKNYAMMGLPVDEVLTRTNNDLCEGNDAGLFTTAWIGIYEISTGRLTFADAGHETAMKLKPDGKVELLKPVKKKMVLAAMENIRYIVNEAELDVGDMLYIYTDGVTEATSAQNELYGMDRLESVVSMHRGPDTHALLREVRTDVDKFVGSAPQFDDITMLALYINSR